MVRRDFNGVGVRRARIGGRSEGLIPDAVQVDAALTRFHEEAIPAFVPGRILTGNEH